MMFLNLYLNQTETKKVLSEVSQNTLFHLNTFKITFVNIS